MSYTHSENGSERGTDDGLNEAGGFEFNTTGALVKRKDFLDTDAAAKNQSHRTYYYKKDVDILKLLETCTSSLRKRPISVASNNLVGGSSLDLSSHEMDASTRLRILFVRGVAYLRQQQFTKAIEDLTEVISAGPLSVREPLPIESFLEEASDIGALYNRGVAFSKLDMLNDAIEDFTAVLESNPGHVQAAYSRAACYNAQGQLSKAIEDYNLALLKDNGMGGRGGSGNAESCRLSAQGQEERVDGGRGQRLCRGLGGNA
ncbi:hypothetical protein TL16_g08697 [Triparma laevis f. inornata]|uniref:Uncharacterized protein n=1 Tax=Triparma laevis f. inornata TaxID=1714386 RepID=A0A9W7EJ21_9STRA|nr:hypothetical protein TL16_g08697 [Triparma laevis f. inornata]